MRLEGDEEEEWRGESRREEEGEDIGKETRKVEEPEGRDVRVVRSELDDPKPESRERGKRGGERCELGKVGSLRRASFARTRMMLISSSSL